MKASIIALLFFAPFAFAAGQEAKPNPDAVRSAREIIEFYSDTFGPNPDAKPETFASKAAADQSAQVNFKANAGSEFILAEQIARAWWAKAITPATPNDAWLSDGLARYSAALWIEHAYGKEAYAENIRNFAIGALMYEFEAPLGPDKRPLYEITPIGQAGKLAPGSAQYQSVVQDKGAAVFHMLRALAGDKYFFALLDGYYRECSGKTASLEAFKQLAPKYIPANEAGLNGFFGQWIHSTGIPEPKIEYVVMRTPKGFRVVGKIKQNLDTFALPVELRIETEGNPELKTVDVVGAESSFSFETFGRPKSGGITIDPSHKLLFATRALRTLSIVRHGEILAHQGKLYDAVAEYNRALAEDPQNALAQFRTGEAFFYMDNWQPAANAFREAMNGNMKECRWVEVWSHIYLGKIFDFLGRRERAVNEYSKAIQTKDDTAGAQAEADRYLKQPFGQKPTPTQ